MHQELKSYDRSEIQNLIIKSDLIDLEYLTHYFGAVDHAQLIAAADKESGALSRSRLSPIFDGDFYARYYRDVEFLEIDPFQHYVTIGFWQHRKPSAHIEPSLFKELINDRIDANRAKLEDQLERTLLPISIMKALCSQEEIVSSHFFGHRYYGGRYEDLRDTNVDLFRHFASFGQHENRSGCDFFDLAHYEQVTGCRFNGALDAIKHLVLNFDGRLVETRPDTLCLLERSAFGQLSVRAFPAVVRSTGSGAGGRRIRQRDRLESAWVNWSTEKKITDYEAFAEEVGHLKRRRLIRVFGETDPIPDPIRPDELDASDREKTRRHSITVLIPFFSGLDRLRGCVRSVLAQSYPGTVEIVIADDASEEDARSLAAELGVRCVRQEKNLGFLQNVNAAATSATGEFLLLLNDDCELRAHSLEVLAAGFRDPHVGICGPKLVFPDGRLQEAGGAIFGAMNTEMVGLSAPPELPCYGFDRDADYVSGAALVIRRSLWESLGGFDPDLAPAYCEDLDLCVRASGEGWRIRYRSDALVEHAFSATSNALSRQYKYQNSIRNKIKLVRKHEDRTAHYSKVLVGAFYLPQFHDVAENDYWWGRGFTDWANTVKAESHYRGHEQPRLPTELGFYDLNSPEVIEKQFDLARSHGVDFFNIYYYRFGDTTILDRPLQNILRNPSLRVRFACCWANENWARRWDGGDEAVLLKQDYSEASLDAVIDDFLTYAEDPRYLRVGGKPTFSFYRPLLVDRFAAFADRFRQAAHERGHGEVLLKGVMSMELGRVEKSATELGLDALLEFPPHDVGVEMDTTSLDATSAFEGRVFDYAKSNLYMIERRWKYPVRVYPTVFPSWDNTPRQDHRAHSFFGASPGRFQIAMEEALTHSIHFHPAGERVVYINAWNEWAEGAVMEPDRHFGRGWLNAVRNAKLKILGEGP